MTRQDARSRGNAAADQTTRKEPEEMLTVTQVAERVGTTPTTVRRWLLAGKLAGVRPGGTKLGWRIPSSAVDELLTPTRRGEEEAAE